MQWIVTDRRTRCDRAGKNPVTFKFHWSKIFHNFTSTELKEINKYKYILTHDSIYA